MRHGSTTHRQVAISYSLAVSLLRPSSDECVTGSHNCSANATCSDTESGFTCSCNSGYIGDGVTCEVEICSECLCTAGGISHSMPSSDYKCTEASFGVVVTKKTAPENGDTAEIGKERTGSKQVNQETPYLARCFETKKQETKFSKSCFESVNIETKFFTTGGLELSGKSGRNFFPDNSNSFRINPMLSV